MSHTCNGRRGVPALLEHVLRGTFALQDGRLVTVSRNTWLCGLCGKGHVKSHAMVLVAAAAPPWVSSPEEV